MKTQLGKVAHCLVAKSCPTLCDSMDCKPPAALSMEFSRQEYWFSSVAQSCPIPCDLMDCSMPGFPVHHQIPEPTQTRVHCVSDGIQPSHPHCPLLLPPSIFPSIRVFSNESVLHIRIERIGVSASASGVSVNIQGWFPLGWTGWILAVQGTLRSLLQHHSSKASIL